MTVTRYSGVNQAPKATQTIYTVPDGKVAKLVFNGGYIEGKKSSLVKALNDTYDIDTISGVNSCGAVSTTYGAQFLIGGRLIFGSDNSYFSSHAYGVNVFFNGDKIFIASASSSIGVIEYNMPSIELATSNAVLVLKNEFILVAGDTVQISTDDDDYMISHVSYDFNIYEDEI